MIEKIKEKLELDYDIRVTKRQIWLMIVLVVLTIAMLIILPVAKNRELMNKRTDGYLAPPR